MDGLYDLATVSSGWGCNVCRLLHFYSTVFLHHDGISQAIFQNAAVNIESSFADQELNALCNAKEFLASFVTSGAWDTQKFLKVLSEIRAYSLIDFDDKAKLYSIHPLVHDWICVTMSHGEDT